MNVWIMSNRQPWTDFLVKNRLKAKTRDTIYIKPGDIVFLHASKALWSGWRNLAVVQDHDIDVSSLPRGGVCGVAKVGRVGKTDTTMPDVDYEMFEVRDGSHGWNCAMMNCVVFDMVLRLPLLECQSAQVPAKKLPVELRSILDGRENDLRARLYRDAVKTLERGGPAKHLKDEFCVALNTGTQEVAPDGLPFNFYDVYGGLHMMCACGHRHSGVGLQVDGDHTICPNCMLTAKVHGGLTVQYPELIHEKYQVKK